MKKILEVDMPSPLGGGDIDEVRAKMHAAIDANVPEAAREAARRQAEELLTELRGKGAVAMSAHSIIGAIRDCAERLERLPRAVRGIAQALDAPSHIFELGGACEQLIVAQGLLEIAMGALERTVACDHCKPATTDPADHN